MYENLQLVRLTTAGSVDDGKSTLIGRLLYDCNALYEDQIRAARSMSAKKGFAELDFSLFTDGLAAEREQQITIDVAYRYFSTPKRRFIIADVPGHEQYTRNMVTGASNADVALILVDARKGVVTQSRRHLFIASLLNIPHILIVVNKMDEVDYSREVFERIQAEVVALAVRMKLEDLQFAPISALEGDMVVTRGDRMPWYQGRTLYDYLENVQIAGSQNLIDFRFPVQMVLRPNQDFRGFAGRVESGIIRVGDQVAALPSGKRSAVKSILVAGREEREAFLGQSAVLTLADEIDVSRGDVIARDGNLPDSGSRLEATISWFSKQPFEAGRSYLLKHTTKTVRCFIEKLRYSIDVDSLHRQPAQQLCINDIGRAYLKTTEALVFDPYVNNRHTGSFILIDEVTRETCGAGMIVRRRHSSADEERALTAVQGALLWLTGLPGSGKTTLAEKVGEILNRRGVDFEHLDGDEFRKTLSKGLGFTPADRDANIERAAHVARLLVKHKIIVLASFVSPAARQRQIVRDLVPNMLEVYVNAPLEVCMERDPKGMYREARDGRRAMFTGLQQEYEAPPAPDLELHTDRSTVDECAESLIALLLDRNILM